MANDGRNVLAYTGVRATTPPQQVINRKRAPTANDYLNFNIGDQWLFMDTVTPTASILYVLVSKAQGVAVWQNLNGEAPIWPDHAVALGTGSTALNSVAPSTAGLVLTSNGVSADPTWQEGGSVTLPDHSVALGTGAPGLNSVGPSENAGYPLLSQGAVSDPVFDILTVTGGGTGTVTFTPYAPVCAGTTATGAFQSADSNISTSGFVLTSTGSGSLPTWQASGSGLTSLTGDAGGAVSPTDGNINITSNPSNPAIIVTGFPGSSTLQIVSNTSYNADTGTATIQSAALNFVGGTNVTTSATGNTITINATGGGGGGGGLLNVQVFDASGSYTYTPTSGMTECIVECLGAGGGAGGSSTTPTAGAAGGSYCRDIFDAATIGASQPLVVGAGGAGTILPTTSGTTGGDTTFGTFLTATGGGGSQAGVFQYGQPGNFATGGDVNVQGQSGNSGNSTTGGLGGSSIYGAGGTPAYSSGLAGGYGAGGGGNPTGTGGNGSDGLVIITEFGGSGGGGGIMTLDGDSGSATGSTVTISGAEGISTIASGSTVSLYLDSPVAVANGGTGVGTFATPYAPICVGTTSTGDLQIADSGLSNSGYVLTSTGSGSLPTWQAVSGGSGIVTLDADTGSATGTTVTIAGGTGITTSATGATVTINATGSTVLTITAVNFVASPYTVLSTDQFIAVDPTGGAISILLPNAPTTGQVVYIKDSTGQAAIHNITVTTVGGTVTIDGVTSFVMNTAYEAISVIFDGTNYEIF